MPPDPDELARLHLEDETLLILIGEAEEWSVQLHQLQCSRWVLSCNTYAAQHYIVT